MAIKKNMDPIMLDLETLGTSPNSVILSIGACKFDPDNRTITDRFYTVINKESALAIGLTVQADTQAWWDKQSEEARRVLHEAEGKQKFKDINGEEKDALPVQEAMERFAEFAHWNSCVWGNGSDFDNAMVQEVYKKLGKRQPWAFWNNRCYRTMKNMVPGVSFERMGTYHNALDDAITQAYHLMDILAIIRKAYG